jgi:AraC family transcriptional regulator
MSETTTVIKMGWDLDLSRFPGGGAIDLDVFKRKSWPGVTAHFVRIAAPVTYGFKLKSTSNYVALHDLYRVDGETIARGLPPSLSKDLRGKLAFIPAGCDVEGWTKIEKAASIVVVMIDGNASKRLPDLTALAPRLDFDDQTLRFLMLRFQAILDDPSLDVPGYAETLAELVMFELTRTTRRAPASPPEPQSTSCGLTTSQLGLVSEYIDRHLNEKITVSELAALVDLTRFHFIRSFKQSTGMPPLQFVIRRRIERARELLAEGGTSVAEVADRSGFGSSVQMTRAFRRVVGTTPSAIRRGI